jgi:hypothetical protein
MRYPRNRKITGIALALLAAFVLASCTGSGSNSSSGQIAGVSLSPLVVADNVSVVDPQQTQGSGQPVAAGIKSLLIGMLSTQLPATSDYFADKTSVYVNERSVESFRTINEILCSVKQSRYDAMINQGPYLALVDQNLCRSDRDNASSAGAASMDQSSGASMPRYQTWVVDSYRTSDTSPHIVRVWVFEEATTYDPAKLILARMTIIKGADTAPPYGIFKIDFQAVDPLNPLTELFRGVLIAEPDPRTGKALLKFASEDPAFHYVEKATLAKNPDGLSGAGTVYKTEIRPPLATVDQFDIAYNATHFLRHDFNGNDICLDRVNFDESAWRYGLYTEPDGSRVNLNAGFSIKKGADFGWVGYWGVWLPEGMTLANGDTVYKHDFQTNTDTPFTVFQSGGKLKRHTKNSLTLDKIRNVPLVWSDCSVSPCDNYAVITVETIPGSGLYEFWKVAKQNPAPDYTWQPFGPALLGLSTLYSSDLYFWSQALGGQVRVSLTGCTYDPTGGTYSCPPQTATTQVIFYAEDIVYPDDPMVPTSLACFDNCPDTVDDGAGGKINTVTPVFPMSQTAQPTQHDYTFDNTALLLKSSSTGFAAVQKDPLSGYDWGFMSGALFAPTAANLAMLDCNWDGDNDPTSFPAICGWKAWSVLNVFYTWETGLNPWSKFTGLIDGAGAFVRFDPPLQVQYVHHAPSNPTLADLKYDGVTFYLEYNGFGNLSGIPGTCVDVDSGADSPCGTNTRWVPEFTVPDKQASGDLTAVYINGNPLKPLIVKALEKEQRMKDAGAAACADDGLIATPYPLPSITEWDPPAIGTVPNITSGPKVIGGIVQ